LTFGISIRVEEIGQQRASLIGGNGQFGSTLGIAYTLFDLLNREELLSAQLEGGPESLQIMLGLAKEGIFGTRASLAFSVFNNVLRPRFATSAQGPFFTSHNVGISVPWTYAASNTDSLAVGYTLSHATSDYRILFPPTSTGVTSSDVRTKISSRTLSAGWAHDTSNERLVFSSSVSGGVLGGGENMFRASSEYGRILRDPIFSRGNAWAFRTTFSGAGSYRGEMPFFSRFFSGDEIVRGLRPGELGPYALAPNPTQSVAGTYSVVPAGANLIAGANGSRYDVGYATTNDSGNYSVVLSNSVAATNLQASIYVYPQYPYFFLPLRDQSVPEGATAAFVAWADGGPPPNYYWFFNGNPLSVPDSPVLTLVNVTTRSGSRNQQFSWPRKHSPSCAGSPWWPRASLSSSAHSD